MDSAATSGLNNGLSWTNAPLLTHSLRWKQPGKCNAIDTIKVAQGTYYPGTTRDDNFIIPDSLKYLVVMAGMTAGIDSSLRI